MAEVAGFIEKRFPESVAYGYESGPEYETSVTNLFNGREKRLVNRNRGKLVFNCEHGLKEMSEVQILMNFFREMRGRGYGFRMYDHIDHHVDTQEIDSGDGVKKVFQIVKIYGTDNPEVRIIHKPVAGSCRVWVNGVERASGWTLDHTTGKITFDVAPPLGHSIVVDCEFDVPARFDEDSALFNLASFNVVGWAGIRIKEIWL
jgi:uncharacterized protein (TIGR02217 family)